MGRQLLCCKERRQERVLGCCRCVSANCDNRPFHAGHLRAWGPSQCALLFWQLLIVGFWPKRTQQRTGFPHIWKVWFPMTLVAPLVQKPFEMLVGSRISCYQGWTRNALPQAWLTRSVEHFGSDPLEHPSKTSSNHSHAIHIPFTFSRRFEVRSK